MRNEGNNRPGALERLLRLPGAAQTPLPLQMTRRILTESRKWESDLNQAVDLSYAVQKAVPMVGHFEFTFFEEDFAIRK